VVCGRSTIIRDGVLTLSTAMNPGGSRVASQPVWSVTAGSNHTTIRRIRGPAGRQIGAATAGIGERASEGEPDPPAIEPARSFSVVTKPAEQPAVTVLKQAELERHDQALRRQVPHGQVMAGGGIRIAAALLEASGEPAVTDPQVRNLLG